MTKAQIIRRIIEAAKSAAIVEGRYCDTTDLFFTLAFTSDRALRAICKKLGG
jgi:hypothetical protein